MIFFKKITKQTRIIGIFTLLSLFLMNGVVASEQNAGHQNQTAILLDVYKNPNCGCCKKWISHLAKNGFNTTAHNIDDIISFKEEKSIGSNYQSCHTGVSKDGYVFEGHIPSKYIKRFLQEKPKGAIGLAVPNMPMGSPGMEMGDSFSPYDILLLKADGTSKIYAQIKKPEEQY